VTISVDCRCGIRAGAAGKVVRSGLRGADLRVGQTYSSGFRRCEGGRRVRPRRAGSDDAAHPSLEAQPRDVGRWLGSPGAPRSGFPVDIRRIRSRTSWGTVGRPGFPHLLSLVQCSRNLRCRHAMTVFPRRGHGRLDEDQHRCATGTNGGRTTPTEFDRQVEQADVRLSAGRRQAGAGARGSRSALRVGTGRDPEGAE